MNKEEELKEALQIIDNKVNNLRNKLDELDEFASGAYFAFTWFLIFIYAEIIHSVIKAILLFFSVVIVYYGGKAFKKWETGRSRKKGMNNPKN